MITKFKIFEDINPKDITGSKKKEFDYSIQTIIDGKRDVGFISDVWSPDLDRIKEKGLKVIKTKPNTYIVYKDEKKAKRLFDIASKHKGFLNDQSPEEAREIGELLGYTKKSIDNYIKRNYGKFEKSENSLFESNSEENMINDMFSRCDKKEYMKYISEADIELFSINDKFDELETRKHFLKDEYNIEVVEVEKQKLVSFYDYSNDIEDIIGNQPILLYHYTSSNLLESIQKDGLKTGFKKTNPFSNSYSGVYLTTETSGQAVSNYAKIAVRKHGGKGIQLYIKTNFGNIGQDPDDADLRSGKFQFITEYVSPEQIIFYEEYFY